MGNEQLRTRVEQLGCASLVDAMGRIYHHRAHLYPLTSPDPSRMLFGPVVTIAFIPYRDDLPDGQLGLAALFYRAIQGAPPGAVLVLSAGGYPDASHGGGTKLSRLHDHGLAGVLTDGRLRDFAELASYDFATWCGGEATHWGGDTVMPFAANVTVEVGGVCVTPGDYAYADRSGGVIIPAASVHRVVDEAERIERDDTRFREQIRTEDPTAVRDGTAARTEP
ncbi:RraA family protein [Saccharopolyspora phatthalungensis]|uniref:Putative 4-hydroxy-4-methyl-2-oxoglutarate aldolase n=1 Tax=Saccharopolyspora phatthalungensis TaxID=664693 RepID=A0A840Q168_9PSEU|nr:RraA family protein [Saccharopolyspora phatthalungensis]MBB5154114.1 regulator of RNase E activity RraA [Saccharopolyspora phatthalungensis]